MFNPITAADNIKEEFIGYISTLFHISDKEYAAQFREELHKEGAVTKGPYLDISDSYKTGKSLGELINEGEASPLFKLLEGDIPDGDKEIQINRGLYLHQELALRKTNQGKNLIVTTGTGSGKTECFIIPIINHLLKEAEAGTLTSGVRAILIYPMNALANDQMKRLRNLLKNYPDITFGVYNSSTKQNEEDGLAEYKKVYKDDNGYPLIPMKNEMISRDRMQQTPPHILVTNYAMLEYMMLRPKDDLVFSGAKLRFLVLDEAHIYRGTTGMETSLLLKRLKARISKPDNVLHILTSATLGGKEADADIVKFAGTLCNADFYPDDIIRSKTVQPSYEKEAVDVPLRMFADLADPQKPLNYIAADYGMAVPEGQAVAEFLYDLCVSAAVYRDLRDIVVHPMTISEITNSLQEKYEITEQDVINIINVAAQANKNKVALIKARYHMFAKALEGAYITLGAPKKLMLNRNRYLNIGGEDRRVFECAVCDDCGRVAVAGKEVNDKLEFAIKSNDRDIEYYLLRDSMDTEPDIENEEDDIEDEAEIGKNDYLLCAKCGAIIHESLKEQMPCSCGSINYVPVRKARKSAAYGNGKCPNCNFGVFKSFYLGYDAATAVLGTSLFEELPESEKVLKNSTAEPEKKKGLFRATVKAQKNEIIKRKRQFLSFSDSRGEAAFFASYMTASYSEFLRRRGIWHVVENNKESMASNPWEIRHFVDELTSYFSACRTFADPGDKGIENLTAVSRKNAWIAVLNEMVSARRSTSLASMGLIKFNYKGNTEEFMTAAAESLGKSPEDTKALFDLLAMDIVYHGALEGDVDLTDDDREYIFYSPKPKRVKKCKDVDKDKKKAYLAGWSAAIRKNGKLLQNGRLKRTMAVLDMSEEEANELLQTYWDEILQGDEALSSAGNDEYYFSTDRFTISAGTEDIPVYQCDVCGKTSMINCQGRCTTLKCSGHLQRILHAELLKDNHYAKLYSSSLMQPLHIKEHTAQLGRKEQQKYQEMFINKDINALSCSTTFEMGVDVGDLETVYLRNMPPSPANYVQRAGRAGRGRNAAAFSLTYSKLNSHDFTYYKNPENMITGKIGVPLFTVRNEKVILRHVFAVALSDFFAKEPDVYNANNADVLLNGDGWERLCSYLQSKPEGLKALLKASIPEDMHDKMGINDFSWTDRLIGDEGVLRIAVEDFRNTVKYYLSERDRYLADGLEEEAAKVKKKLRDYRRNKEDERGRNEIIEFLVRNNVLPKYGFPVDTVELYQNANWATDKKLQMVRDLQLAIAEYAPDAQVVADGKLYTSRYIRKLPQTTGQDWREVYIAECGNPSCKTWNQRTIEPSREGEKCISCGNIIEKAKWKTAIEPRKGFIAESKIKDVPLRKPERSYRSEDYYIGDPTRQVMYKRTFKVADDEKIQMETSADDSLMVVCNDHFFVCNNCGYAISATSGRENKDFNSYAKSYTKKHKAPWGKVCDGLLYRKELCHSFKTDVVRITFGSPRAKSQETMLSVMYALLEAASSVLDIERTDIKGCLHRVRYEHSLVYQVVLYDAVAGGAGHVRRLLTEDCGVFQRVIGKAIEITKNCNCNPSCYNCLRNYYNQSIHDKLSRIAAYSFLEHFYGAADAIPDEQFEETKQKSTVTLTENKVRFSNGYNCADYQSWNEFSFMIPEEYIKLFSDMDQRNVPIPTEAYCKLTVINSDVSSIAMFVWKDRKIIVFDDDNEKLDIQGWTSFSAKEIQPEEFAALFNGGN